jgi:PBP1b-binding outer membrane lipoprotein LpoB
MNKIIILALFTVLLSSCNSLVDNTKNENKTVKVENTIEKKVNFPAFIDVKNITQNPE